MARKKGRDIDGILLLDKPAGATSNAVLRRVSRLLDARKAGHTGSLDPLATGLLVACFGEATKVSGWLLNADKTYQASAQLGVTTDSADADGKVLERRAVPALDRQGLESVLARFRGRQQQIPPMFSALKHEGKRLHELARAGQEVERAPRDVVIHALTGQLDPPDRLRLTVRCSKGTYIRSLVADIGAALGCGAHVGQLRRTGLGPYRDPDMLTPEALEARLEDDPAALADWLLPPESALTEHPAAVIDMPLVTAFQHGQSVPAAPRRAGVAEADAGAATADADVVAAFAGDNTFLGVGVWEGDNRLRPRRLLVQRTTGG